MDCFKEHGFEKEGFENNGFKNQGFWMRDLRWRFFLATKNICPKTKNLLPFLDAD